MGNCFGTRVSKTRDEERMQDIKSIYTNLVSQYLQLQEDYGKVEEELNLVKNHVLWKIDKLKRTEDELTLIKESYEKMRQLKNKVIRDNQVLRYQMEYML